MNFPLKNYIVTQRFGEKITDPQGHTGIDLWQPTGTPVYAADGGDILAAGIINNAYGNSQYGQCMLIDHKNGLYTFYAHMNKVLFKKGMSVIAGAQIGTVGATGNVTGEHLHFEVRTNPIWNRNNFVNPEKYLTFIDKPNIINTEKPLQEDNLKEGDEVQVLVDLMNMRNSAGYSSNIITQLRKGVKLKIAGNKIIEDNLVWYPVQLYGYVAESDGYSKLIGKDN